MTVERLGAVFAQQRLACGEPTEPPVRPASFGPFREATRAPRAAARSPQRAAASMKSWRASVPIPSLSSWITGSMRS